MDVHRSQPADRGALAADVSVSVLDSAGHGIAGIVIIADSGTGVLDHDLRSAALAALDIPRERCRTYATAFTWKESARQFLDNIETSRSELKVAIAPSPGSFAASNII